MMLCEWSSTAAVLETHTAFISFSVSVQHIVFSEHEALSPHLYDMRFITSTLKTQKSLDAVKQMNEIMC